MPEQTSITGADIRLYRVRREYKQTVAVDDLSLDVKAGEFISLLGPSGSGKSTLLMMIAGFESLSAGRISLAGRDITSLPPERRGIGMVFQSYALFPHMTVAENIAFPLKQRKIGRAEIETRVQQALDLVQLAGFGTRYPAQLSGGQQQRVAIARAVVFRPSVLLMDEPLSALDKQLRETMQFEIKSLHERLGITFVYVTHDQREALVMSDRVVVLKQGRIEQIGSPFELYDTPCNRFVASFIGEANFLKPDGIGEPQDGYCKVRLGQSSVWARISDTDGDASVCIVRPEKIRLVASATPKPDGTNMLDGIVRQAIYMGDTVRYTVESGSNTLHVRQFHTFGAPRPQPGETIWLQWSADDTQLV